MVRVTFPVLLFVALVTCVATYNTINMVRSREAWATYEAKEGSSGAAAGRQSASDSLVRLPEELKQDGGGGGDGGVPKRLFHVVVTANESPYNRWQCRIMYFWYTKVKDAPGSEMGGFTRVLHSGQPDNVMAEIPTFVVDPLPPGEDRGYVVLNRPWAFVQWLQKANITEDYILMAEPDHLFIRPLPNLATEATPAAFPFFYITPSENEKVLRKFFPEEKGPITNIDPIGNSPVIINKRQLAKIAPTWSDVSMKMKDDPESDKAFGWVLEMYGYATASALHGIKHELVKDFMLQPPWDTDLGEKYIIHYTYGCDYTMQGKLTYGKVGEWRFDKRSFSEGAPPRNLPLPPPGVPESVRTLVKMVNEATANIPGWKEGE